MSLASYQLLHSAMFILRLISDLRVQRYTFIWKHTNFLRTFQQERIKLLMKRLLSLLNSSLKRAQKPDHEHKDDAPFPLHYQLRHAPHIKVRPRVHDVPRPTFGNPFCATRNYYLDISRVRFYSQPALRAHLGIVSYPRTTGKPCL